MRSAEGYTVLRRAADGTIPLLRLHRGRFPGLEGAFDRAVAALPPGIFAVRARDGAIAARPIAVSRLAQVTRVAYAPSPLAPGLGPLPKTAAPTVYDALRAGPALHVLLAGETVLEADCAAAIAVVDGELWLPEASASRVDSLAERRLVEAFAPRRAALPRSAPCAWIYANAVALVTFDAAPPRLLAAVTEALTSP